MSGPIDNSKKKREKERKRKLSSMGVALSNSFPFLHFWVLFFFFFFFPQINRTVHVWKLWLDLNSSLIVSPNTSVVIGSTLQGCNRPYVIVLTMRRGGKHTDLS